MAALEGAAPAPAGDDCSVEQAPRERRPPARLCPANANCRTKPMTGGKGGALSSAAHSMRRLTDPRCKAAARRADSRSATAVLLVVARVGKGRDTLAARRGRLGLERAIAPAGLLHHGASIPALPVLLEFDELVLDP